MLAQPGQFRDPSKIVQLWMHESERVYGDGLATLEDNAKFHSLLLSQAKRRFPAYNLGAIFGSDSQTQLIFSHFAVSVPDKIYDQMEVRQWLLRALGCLCSLPVSRARVQGLDRVNVVLTKALEEHNEHNVSLNLVLFPDALRHVCRITRIVNMLGGHALLVGVGGSGKQSLARLAAYVCGYAFIEVIIYTLACFVLLDVLDNKRVCCPPDER